VGSLLKLAKLDWPVPDFSTLCRRSSGLTVQIPYRQSTGALHLLVDSTGIKAAGEGEWSTRKHGASRPRSWRKVHLGIDAETMEVRAIEGERASATGPREPANGSRVGDGPMPPGLLAQIPPEEPIGQVTADGACDTRVCHDAIAARQASAVIPTRRNGRTWQETTPGAQARNERLASDETSGPIDLEIVERLSPTKSGGGQDAVPEAPRRTPHGPHLRPSDHRTPHPRRHPEPLHPPRHPRDDPRCITPMGIREASASD